MGLCKVRVGVGVCVRSEWCRCVGVRSEWCRCVSKE